MEIIREAYLAFSASGHGRLLLFVVHISALSLEHRLHLQSGDGAPPIVAGLEREVGRWLSQVAHEQLFNILAEIEFLDVGSVFRRHQLEVDLLVERVCVSVSLS